jgi:hypothetical protein
VLGTPLCFIPPHPIPCFLPSLLSSLQLLSLTILVPPLSSSPSRLLFSPLTSSPSPPSQHTLVKKRHEALLKAFGCFEQYKQSRLKVTKYSVGSGSIIPKSVTPPMVPRVVQLSDNVDSSTLLDQNNENHSHDNGDDDDDDDDNGGNISSSVIMRRKHPISSVPTPVSIPLPVPIPVRLVSESQPENVSDEALLQEVHYNYSKAFSELKLFHLAEKHLRLALALADEHERLRGNSYDGKTQGDRSGSSGSGDRENGSTGAADSCNGSGSGIGASGGTGNHFSHLQVTREAAHNLVLIYRKSGAMDQALHIMQKYLMF